MNKTKILLLADHALMNSGVATQSRFLSKGLINSGKYQIFQFGAAKKHSPDTKTIKLSDDWFIEPVNGFGTKQQVRRMLTQWKPDVIFLFTDPRFFTWLFEMEDEIHQVCPIVWWHVWDNYPFPEFNTGYYDATDAINCHSHMTYTMLSETKYKDKTKFIPHAVPKTEYYPMTPEATKLAKQQILPGKEDHWTCYWINKNFGRKRPADLMLAWSFFVNRVEKEEGHRNVNLFMHTNPRMPVGANLIELSKHFKIEDTVTFSTDHVDFKRLNEHYNISDVTINIANAEGFGLATLESMMTGTPIIAPLLGGQTRQIIDHRTGVENGRALPIEMRTLNSTQQVPYIYDEWCSSETIAQKIWEMYKLSPEERETLRDQVLDYVNFEFDYDNTVNAWDESIQETIRSWRDNYQRYSVERI